MKIQVLCSLSKCPLTCSESLVAQALPSLLQDGVDNGSRSLKVANLRSIVRESADRVAKHRTLRQLRRRPQYQQMSEKAREAAEEASVSALMTERFDLDLSVDFKVQALPDDSTSRDEDGTVAAGMAAGAAIPGSIEGEEGKEFCGPEEMIQGEATGPHTNEVRKAIGRRLGPYIEAIEVKIALAGVDELKAEGIPDGDAALSGSKTCPATPDAAL
ncbi:MAG: hypothetical protein M1816_003120 [Peltula sp. TS41687]|nr:MAG: hypothetical protein M1816_003120 [Peltula sp. TS41687]